MRKVGNQNQTPQNQDFQRKAAEWMQGRYGIDALTRFLMIVACALVIVNFFVHSSFLSVVALIFMGYATFRCFSRASDARRKELALYENLMVKPRAWWARTSAQREARKRSKDAKDASRTPSGTPSAAASGAESGESAFGKKAKAAGFAGKRPRANRQAGHVDKDVPADASSGMSIIFPCDGCGQNLSVPVGKGTVRVTCPRCGAKMTRRS